MTDEERQDYVVNLADRINKVLAGERSDDAQTALTLAVACQIVAAAASTDQIPQISKVFASQLDGFVRRDDMVEWIKAHTTFAPAARRDQ
jgi:hypothetical protein